MTETVRPTKKQRALLDYIAAFIGQHGYSPSYREIMNGCGYNSIATVAVHINNLIARGHLRKRDHSARSLELTSAAGDETEVVPPDEQSKSPSLQAGGEAWLKGRIEALLQQAEQAAGAPTALYEDIETLLASLPVLGLHSAAEAFAPRLRVLKLQTQEVAAEATDAEPDEMPEEDGQLDSKAV